jgi:hypothetical protein
MADAHRSRPPDGASGFIRTDQRHGPNVGIGSGTGADPEDGLPVGGRLYRRTRKTVSNEVSEEPVRPGTS